MLEQFVASDPADSFSRYALALELEKEGRAGESIAQLREVIDRDGGYVAAYYHLGRLLARDGSVEEARETYRRGMDIASSVGDARTRSEMEEALGLLD
jgi:tetratricopeptide (TPR) repeat protein